MYVVNMHTNNFVPNIVQKGTRRAARRWTRRSLRLADDKARVHRAYRHRMRIRVNNIAKGFVDWDDYDDHAPQSCTLTAWDVW
jgi:hypothetical protein